MVSTLNFSLVCLLGLIDRHIKFGFRKMLNHVESAASIHEIGRRCEYPYFAQTTPLGEIWTVELPAYQQMEHEHRTVVHDDEYVSDEGIHTNQVECLWSLQPWLAKFRGLSKQGLEQAARTYGFLRSFNLVEALIHSLIDCVAINAFR